MREDRVVDREAVILPLVRKILVGPYLPHYLHRLLEQLPVLPVLARVRVGMKLWPLVGPDTPAEAHIHAPSGHVVQHREVLGKPYRVPPRGYVRHLSDANPRRPRREVRAEQDRVRQIADPIRPEVVLSKPHRLEAKLLRQDGLLPEVLDKARGRNSFPSGRRHSRERRKPHVLTSTSIQLISAIQAMVIDRNPTDAMTPSSDADRNSSDSASSEGRAQGNSTPWQEVWGP